MSEERKYNIHVYKKLHKFKMKALFLYLTLSFGVLLMIAPFIWMFSTSLKPFRSIIVMPPKLIPNPLTFENYIIIARTFPVVRWLVNSLFVALMSTFLQLLIGSMAAYAFARLKFKGRDIIFLIYLATLMVPFQVTMIPVFIVMKKLGWINTYQSLILPSVFNAFGVFLLRQFFLTIPTDLEKAAFIDGASHFTVYLKIILPLSKPALATLGIFSFMASWNSFLWPLIVVRDLERMTLPLGLAIMHGRWVSEWNLIMAGNVISIIPMLMVFILFQKYFLKGLVLSGIKG